MNNSTHQYKIYAFYLRKNVSSKYIYKLPRINPLSKTEYPATMALISLSVNPKYAMSGRPAGPFVFGELFGDLA